jgi:5S rRNA maturation endonuclease (ribonuclease M5)
MAAQADFRSLKSRIPIDGVLARYGVKLRLAGPHTLCGPCPLPTHTSGESRQSFSVNLSLQVWSCHSASCIAARGGRIGGHVIDLVAIMERCGLREAGLRLHDWFSVRAPHPLPACPVMAPSSAEPNRPLGFALQRIDTRHPYLARRGISPATARLFGVGIYHGDGFLAGRCVIPIRDEKSRLVAYAGRAVNGEQPRYRFPAGFRKSQLLFNLDRAMQTGGRNVIIVEGFFDALKIHQAGHPAVVALMGASFSQRQSELLLCCFARVTLMLDGDESGRRAAEDIARLLKPKVSVSKVELPNGAQPDHLSSAEINALAGTATWTFPVQP